MNVCECMYACMCVGGGVDGRGGVDTKRVC